MLISLNVELCARPTRHFQEHTTGDCGRVSQNHIETTCDTLSGTCRDCSADSVCKLLWNVGQFLPHYIVQHTRRQPSSPPTSMSYEQSLLVYLNEQVLWRYTIRISAGLPTVLNCVLMVLLRLSRQILSYCLHFSPDQLHIINFHLLISFKVSHKHSGVETTSLSNGRTNHISSLGPITSSIFHTKLH
jgi:hypothetical protein